MDQKWFALVLGLILTSGCASQGRGRPDASSIGSGTGSRGSETQAAKDCPPCADSTPTFSQDQIPARVLDAYTAAIERAKYPTPEKISRDLTPLLETTEGLIWDDQGRVLMTTWTKTEYYADPQKYRRGKAFHLYGDTWLTAVPFTRDFCRSLGFDEPMLALRLEQLLGLPPGRSKDAFLEIWVDPVDLFRPCPDPEISDHECQVEIPVVGRGKQRPWDCNAKPQVSGRFVTVHPDHLQWMCDNWESSYGDEDPLKNYPWTALGYTYDWGDPEDPIGLSEYVAAGGSEVIFESLSSTELYCLPPASVSSGG